MNKSSLLELNELLLRLDFLACLDLMVEFLVMKGFGVTLKFPDGAGGETVWNPLVSS